MGRTRQLIALALAAAALAGCGDEDDQPRPAAAALDLTVRTLQAPGPGRYAARCESDCARQVERWRRLLTRARDRARVCTQIYGGPEAARVTGRLEGEPVDVRVTRTDGCGIEDYKALFALLGRAPPVR